MVHPQHEAGDVPLGDAIKTEQATAAPADPHEAGEAGPVADGRAPEPARAPDAPPLHDRTAEHEAGEEEEGGDAAPPAENVPGEKPVEGQAVEGEVVEPREPGAGEKEQALNSADSGKCVLADTFPDKADGETKRDEPLDVDREKTPGAVAAAVGVVEEVDGDGRVAAEDNGGVEHGDACEVEHTGIVADESGARCVHGADEDAHESQVVSVAHDARDGADGEARWEGGVEEKGGVVSCRAGRLGVLVGEVVVEVQGHDAAKELADGALLVRSDAGEAVAAVDRSGILSGDSRLHNVRLVLHLLVRVLHHVVRQAGAAAESGTPHVHRLVPPEWAHTPPGVQATLVVCPEPQLWRRPTRECHRRRPVHHRRLEEQVSVQEPQSHQQTRKVHRQHSKPCPLSHPLPKRQRHPVHQIHPRTVALPEVLNSVSRPGRTLPYPCQTAPEARTTFSIPFSVTVTVIITLVVSLVDPVAVRATLSATEAVRCQLDVVPGRLPVVSVLALRRLHRFLRSHNTSHINFSIPTVSTTTAVAVDTCQSLHCAFSCVFHAFPGPNYPP